MFSFLRRFAVNVLYNSNSKNLNAINHCPVMIAKAAIRFFTLHLLCYICLLDPSEHVFHVFFFRHHMYTNLFLSIARSFIAMLWMFLFLCVICICIWDNVLYLQISKNDIFLLLLYTLFQKYLLNTFNSRLKILISIFTHWI